MKRIIALIMVTFSILAHDNQENRSVQSDEQQSIQESTHIPAFFSKIPVSENVRELKKLEIDTGFGFWPVLLEDLTSLAAAENLQHLDVHCAKRLANLKPLEKLTSLEWLSIRHTGVTDLASLAGLKNLRELYFIGTKVINLEPLKDLTSLIVLNFLHTGASDLTPLAGLKKLRELHIGSMHVTNLKPLEQLPDLETLTLNITSVTDLRSLAFLKNLKNLHLCGTVKELSFYERLFGKEMIDLAPLAELPNLTDLYIDGIEVKYLASLEKLTNIGHVTFSNISTIDLKPVALLKNLKQLDLINTIVTDFKPLICLENLQRIFLYKTTGDFESLIMLKQLRRLDFIESFFQDKEERLHTMYRLDALRKWLPECELGDDYAGIRGITCFSDCC